MACRSIRGAGDGLPYPAYSYFRSGPEKWDDGLDYFGNERYASAPYFSFMHKLSDIVNAGLAAGLIPQRVEETAHDISCFCTDLNKVAANPPQGLYILWRKA